MFELEVVGAILTLDIIKATLQLSNVNVFTNCLPAITALSVPRPQPGQHLLSTFHSLLSHVGISSNEVVDTRTKEAALGISSSLTIPIPSFSKPLPLSRVAVVVAGAKLLCARWFKERKSSTRYMCLSLFNITTPGKTIERMYKGLSCLQCSVLMQMRTAHIGLNAYLHRFCLAPSPECPLHLVPETVSHFLLMCPRYCWQRLPLICADMSCNSALV
ncbi:hypothetical protein DFH07DRAFT_961297 [Mycena maculata]|uniref:Uncharacterized protein n=1 Tax=Mycena maculata TaxID=230809 RepID=A0AAD7N8V7_9AGAR|nr:hypothetical protein DFH07DRAFT_961297 [Mycena maculata]